MTVNAHRDRRASLRSRASALAIVAALAAGPANAAGPYFIDSPSCRISVFGDFVDADGNGRSLHVTQNGDVKSDNGSTLDFTYASFSGSILNQGLVAFGAAYPSSCSGSGSFISPFDSALSLAFSDVAAGIVNDTTGVIVSEALGVTIVSSLIGPTGGEAGDQVFKNLGSIDAVGVAVGMQSSSIIGTFFNGGTIRSSGADALSIAGAYDNGGEQGGQSLLPTISGSLINEGTIQSSTANAVMLDGVFVQNKVLNAATGQMQGGAGGAGLLIRGTSTINQGVENRGLIAGGVGIAFSGSGTYTGGVTNSGTIEGGQRGVEIAIENYYGGFFNTGSGIVKGVKGAGFYVGTRTGSVARFEGGFLNAQNARISGAAGAVQVAALALNSDFENAGTLAIDPSSGSGSGAGNLAVFRFDTNYYSGDFINTGLIDGRARAGTNGAVLVANTIEGDVTSTGQIFAGSGANTLGLAIAAGKIIGDITTGGTIAGDTALLVTGQLPGSGGEGHQRADIEGDFANSGNLTGGTTGALFEFTNWIGDFTNNANGRITGGVTGARLTGGTMTGSVVNNGLISGGGVTTGFHLSMNSLTGDVTNGASGVLSAASLAWHLEIDALSGHVTNNGLVEATASNGVAALMDNNGGTGSYSGRFTNNGTIRGGTSGGTGLRIDTAILGGVLNTGLLKGTTAFDTRNATGGTVFTQQGANALIDGDMRLSTSYADAVTFKGGALRGSIFGTGLDDDVTVDVASAFAFNGGSVSDIDAFTAKAGVSLMGAAAAGTDGLGMTMTAQSVTVRSGAELYVDDNTLITTRGLNIESGATLTYFLTQNVNQHGVINVFAPPNPITLAAPGQANVAGTIRAHLNDYDAFRTSGVFNFLYTGVIQSSAGINGTFNAVAYAGDVPLGFQYTLQALYDPAANPGRVDLRLFRTAYDELIEDPSDNQQQVGEVLNDVCLTATSGSPLADFCNYIGLLPEEEIPNAFDQVTGYQFPQFSGLGLDLTELLTLPSNENNIHGTAFGTCQQAGTGWCGRQQYAALTSPATASDAMPEDDPFAWLRPGKREVGKTGVWGRYVGNWRNVEGDANARGLRARTDGFAAGVDHVVSEDLMIGVSALLAGTDTAFARAPADEGDIETYQAGAYASWGDADFYLNANATVIWNQFETRRRIQTGPAAFAFADAEFDGFGGTGFIEMGAVYEQDGFRFQPLASLFYLTHTTDGFDETGAPTLNLRVGETTTESLRSSLGARLAHPWKWGETRFVPELRAAWRHEFLDTRQDSTVAFAHAPALTMTIAGSDQARDMAVLGFGLSASLGQGTVLYSDVDGAFNADKNSVQASVGVRHSW